MLLIGCGSIETPDGGPDATVRDVGADVPATDSGSDGYCTYRTCTGYATCPLGGYCPFGDGCNYCSCKPVAADATPFQQCSSIGCMCCQPPCANPKDCCDGVCDATQFMEGGKCFGYYK
jgi:hypothetical protein